jgi:hypothetical protein
VKIQCVLDFEEEITEAQEVLFAIDELNAAMNLRIGLQDDGQAAGTTFFSLGLVTVI